MVIVVDSISFQLPIAQLPISGVLLELLALDAAAPTTPANERAQHQNEYEQTGDDGEQQEQGPVGQGFAEEAGGGGGDQGRAAHHQAAGAPQAARARLLQAEGDLLAVVGAGDLGGARVHAEVRLGHVLDAQLGGLVGGRERWVIAIQTKIQLPYTLPTILKLCNWYYHLK